MTRAEERINELFEGLVPDCGKADPIAGEIVRAISRIGYRYLNDGDHIGVGYGNETCNPAARFLMEKIDSKGADFVADMWGVYGDEEYEEILHKLEEDVVAFLEDHPELKEQENTEDMFDYFDANEDR